MSNENEGPTAKAFRELSEALEGLGKAYLEAFHDWRWWLLVAVVIAVVAVTTFWF